MKRLLACLLTLTLLVVSAAALADESTAKSEKRIIFSIQADPVTLDPTINNVSPGTTITAQLFGGLFKYAKSGSELIPDLAEGYTISEDGLTYFVTLKENAKFSDGSAITAQDVYYSYLRCLDPLVGSTLTTDLRPIKNADAYNKGEVAKEDVGIQVIDDRTIAFTVEVVTPWFLSQSGGYKIVKANIAEDNPDWLKSPETIICSGPFLITSIEPKAKYALAKNPYYYRAEEMAVEAVDIVIIEAAEAELTAYANGEIDVADNLNADATLQYKDTPEFFITPRLGIQYCDFNCELPQFTDARVRKALAMAIDRQWILTNILQTTQPPVFGFVPNSQPSLTDPSKSYREVAGDLFKEDIEEAKRLLAEAGYPNGEGFPSFQVVVRSTAEQVDLAQALQALWQQNLGINCEIVTYEASSTYWSELAEGNFGVDRSGYTVGYLDPGANLLIWTTGGNAFENRWDDPAFDEIIAKANAELDPALREQLIIEAETYLVEQMPGFPVYSYDDSYLVKPYILDLLKPAAGRIGFEYATFAD
ncbi:MAG: peptide ABC transporter substrate-binding protein [Oscillospiraceae bacterium]|jgi:oligopeptide transport system substrate-binding protein|nr:peptide ABC transporter substrate-binding protein [Oscillospiraceae bacterium]